MRFFWEPFSLLVGILTGSIPVLLIAGLIAWNASDPGCSCYSQKVVLSKIKIETWQPWIYGSAAVLSLCVYLLLRRIRVTSRDLLDVVFCAVVFGGAYYLLAPLFGEAPSPEAMTRVPFQSLVPVNMQTGFFVPYWPEPYFYPWKVLYRFLNGWQFFAASACALICALLFGERFGLVERIRRAKAPEITQQTTQ